MKNTLLLLILFISFFACRPKETILQDSARVEYIHRLTPVILPSETAAARALLECSKEGAILISDLSIETSKNTRLNMILDSLGNLSVDAEMSTDTIYLPSDSVIITKDVTRTEIAYKEKELTWWQNIKQEAGGIAMGGCMLLIAFVIFKFFAKTK